MSPTVLLELLSPPATATTRPECSRQVPLGLGLGLSLLLAASPIVAPRVGAQEQELDADPAGDAQLARVIDLSGPEEMAVWKVVDGLVTTLRGRKVSAPLLSGPPDALPPPFEIVADVASGVEWFEIVLYETQGTFAVVWEQGDGRIFAQCMTRSTCNPLGSPVEIAADGAGVGGTITKDLPTAAEARVSYWAATEGDPERRRVNLGFNCAIVPPAPDSLAFLCEDPAAVAFGDLVVTACASPPATGPRSGEERGAGDRDIRLALETDSGTTELTVNTYTTGLQFQPAIARGPGGTFVVTWTSFGSPGDDQAFSSIQARRLDATGSPVGDQFQVNSYTSFYQLAPAVAIEEGGAFVVVWDSFGSPGDDAEAGSIQVRRFAASGAPEGDQLQLNSYTTSVQQRPDVQLEDGLAFVAWESAGSAGADDDGFSVQGLFHDFGLFLDGFESGDVGAWAATR